MPARPFKPHPPPTHPPPPCAQIVRTTTVCRVLSISRTAYMALAASFPLSTEIMLDNLLNEAQEVGDLI